MSVALTANFLAELRKGTNTPTTIIEVEYDSGNIKYGTHDTGFTDVLAIIGRIPSLQTKLDTKKGYSTRGQISFNILGRDNFKPLIRDEYFKNRRVNRYDGFAGLAFVDYVKTFTGTVQDLKRKGDSLTVTVADDVQDTKIKLPVANATKTQSIDYTNTNPIDIMLDILKVQLGIDASLVDTTTFELERDTWRNSWVFDRVLRKPTKANDYLNELQEQTQSFIIHDGQQISLKVVAPPTPSQVVKSFTDDDHILLNSLSWDSGYTGRFFNNIVVYFDWDESDNDDEGNFESAEIVANTDSQGSAQWDEISTKVIKSKWLRTYTYTQPVNVTGVEIYHVSKANGINAGATGSSIAYTFSTNSLTWTAPDGTTGASVPLDNDGTYRLFDANLNKYIRVIVTLASLPVSDKNDTIDITAINGSLYANELATKLLQKYVDPVASVSFSLDINELSNGGNLLKASDTVQMTTDEAFDNGQSSWALEQLFVTKVIADFNSGVLKLEAEQSRAGYQSGKRYAFIIGGNEITYTGLTGSYTIGETITGGTSSATAIVTRDTGSVLSVIGVVGTFQTSETITGGTSGATATTSVLEMPPSYPTATDAQRFYGFMGDASNQVDGGTVEGYFII